MRPMSLKVLLTAALFLLSINSSLIGAQASPSIQFFMPDGSLPNRELRFTLSNDAGRIETYFTDSKGKFLLTRSLGLKPDSEYRVTINGDGNSFGTTTQSFKEYSGVYYITVYLNPPHSKPVAPAKVVDLAEFDVKVPPEAKQAYEDAMRQFKERRADEAVSSLERAISIFPDYFRALNDLGVIYLKMNRLDDATRVFERATKIAPEFIIPD